MKILFKDSRALTLIEMMIVIFIISLVLAAVLPSFSGFGARDAVDDARLMVSVIRHLSDTSRNTGDTQYMTIDIDGNTVSYSGDKEEVIKEIDSVHSVKITSAEEKRSGSIRIEFQPSGLSERLLVRFAGASDVLDVLYNPYSGRVTIQRGSDEVNETRVKS